MGINEMVEKFKTMKDRVDWKRKAKERYVNFKDNVAEKEVCACCREIAENIIDGDTVMIILRKAKALCVDDWHETAGQVQKIFDGGKKMLFIGYEKLLAGFTVTKICPHCHRIICVKEFR